MNQRFETRGFSVERDLSPGSRCEWKVQTKLGSPYIIKQIYSGGAIRLMDLDANPFTKPTNMDQLKKYHV